MVKNKQLVVLEFLKNNSITSFAEISRNLPITYKSIYHIIQRFRVLGILNGFRLTSKSSHFFRYFELVEEIKKMRKEIGLSANEVIRL